MLRLLDRGWAWHEVVWLTTSNLPDMRGHSLLRWRLDRVEAATPEEARRDPMLNRQRSSGGRTSSRAGRPGEFGGKSGFIDPDTDEVIEPCDDAV